VDKITSLGAMRATLRIAKVMRHAELTWRVEPGHEV
jgi:hypothetical protein